MSRAFAVFKRDGRAASAECYAFYTMVCYVSCPGETGEGERGKKLTEDNRYGDDGTWSAVSIRVGTPPQWVDVMVNTVSSETWVVGPAGCKDNSELEDFVLWNKVAGIVGGAEGFTTFGGGVECGFANGINKGIFTYGY